MRKPPLANQVSVKLVLILLGIFIFFNLFIMPSLTGDQKVTPLDLQFAYTPTEAYELIDTYSDETRKNYVLGEMTKDLAYPVVYTLFMSLLILLLYPNQWKLAWFPYSIFISDLLENTGIITLLLNYPDRLPTIAWMTSVITTVKWVLVLVAIIIIINGLRKKFCNKNLSH